MIRVSRYAIVVCAALATAVLAWVPGCTDRPPKAGVRFVYEITSQGSARSVDALIVLLTHRIDPEGTANYVLRVSPDGQQLEVTMLEARAEDVAAVKRLLGLNGYATFRVCADPKDVPNAEKMRENRLGGLEATGEYEWVPLEWNSKKHWDRVSELLFGRANIMTRKEALGRFIGEGVVYVIRDTNDLVTPASDEVSDVEIIMLRHTLDVDGGDFDRFIKGMSFADGSPIILFYVRPEAQGRFAELCANNVGRRMAVVFDGRVRATSTIRSQMREKGIIGGFRTSQECDEMAAVLNAGMLGVRLRLLREERF